MEALKKWSQLRRFGNDQRLIEGEMSGLQRSGSEQLDMEEQSSCPVGHRISVHARRPNVCVGGGRVEWPSNVRGHRRGYNHVAFKEETLINKLTKVFLQITIASLPLSHSPVGSPFFSSNHILYPNTAQGYSTPHQWFLCDVNAQEEGHGRRR
jgi:hypothetical protein